jgi:hypothetical protein
MKKAVVLLAVLLVASLSNAEIMLSLDGQEFHDGLTKIFGTHTIGIYNSGSGALDKDFYAYLTFSPAVGEYSLSNPRLGPAAGDGGSSFDGPYIASPPDDFQEVDIFQQWNTASTEIPGTIFMIDIWASGRGYEMIELWDERNDFTGPVATLDIRPVPEPATIAFLGLGALILRKRR